MCGEFCRRGLTIRGEGLLSIFFEKMFYGFYQPAGCGATQRWHLRYPYHHAALLRWHRGDLVGCVSTKMAGWGWRIIREIGEFQLGKHGLCESLSQGKLQEGQQKSVVKSDFFAHHVSTSPCKLVAFLCFFPAMGCVPKKTRGTHAERLWHRFRHLLVHRNQHLRKRLGWFLLDGFHLGRWFFGGWWVIKNIAPSLELFF